MNRRLETTDYAPRATHGSAAPIRPGLWWVLGRDWDALGFRQGGWLLLPLRGFLGVTFTVAAFQKLANPGFFDPASPTSVQAQMRAVAPASPIGPLVELGLHAGWLMGLVIALAELAVGLGTILGLKARLAACGGAVLALSFFLTVSWTTTPYYYGADIVFLFAWTPFIAVGAAGVLSLDALLAGPARPTGRTVARDAHQQMLERRALVGVGAVGVLLAGVAAVAGRLTGSAAASPGQAVGPTGQPTHTPAARPAHTPAARPARHPAARTRQQGKQSSPPAGMKPITAVSKIPVGEGRLFTDPATGNPAWLVRPATATFTAFSAVCTHAGCTVQYNSAADEFMCPCHGGTYNARTGQVLGGPPPAPLPAIPVDVQAGTVYAK